MWKELSDQVTPEKRTYSLGLVGQVPTPITDVWKGQVLPEEAGSIDQISPESVKNARDLLGSQSGLPHSNLDGRSPRAVSVIDWLPGPKGLGDIFLWRRRLGDGLT